MNDINKIRMRANAAELTNSQQVTIEYILDERARELFLKNLERRN